MNDKQRVDLARNQAAKIRQAAHEKLAAIKAENGPQHNEKYISYNKSRGTYTLRMFGKYQDFFYTIEGARKRKQELLAYGEVTKEDHHRAMSEFNEKYISFQKGRNRYLLKIAGKYCGSFKNIEGARKRKEELLNRQEAWDLEASIKELETKLAVQRKKLEQINGQKY